MDADAQRKAAGERAAELVQDGMAIGFGTGRAANAALESLARRKLRVRGVPPRRRRWSSASGIGLSPVVSLDDHPPHWTWSSTEPTRWTRRGSCSKEGRRARARKAGGALGARGASSCSRSRSWSRAWRRAACRWRSCRSAGRARLTRIAALLAGAGGARASMSDNGGVVVDAPLPAGRTCGWSPRAQGNPRRGRSRALPRPLAHLVVGGAAGVRADQRWLMYPAEETAFWISPALATASS